MALRRYSVKFILLIYSATNLCITYSVSFGDSQVVPDHMVLDFKQLTGAGFQTSTKKCCKIDINYTHQNSNGEGMCLLFHTFCAPIYSFGRERGGLVLALSATAEILSLFNLITSYSPFLPYFKRSEGCQELLYL